MRKPILLSLFLFLALAVSGQTARKFVLKNSSDGVSELTAYLPEHPTGRAIVNCPGGGYTHLAIGHERHD